MIYDLSKHIDNERFDRRVAQLKKNRTVVELTEKTSRSNAQNAYLHLIIGYFALEYGCTAEEAKVFFYKDRANQEIFRKEFIDPHTGEKHIDRRSTATLTKEEMALSIDRFRNWSSVEAGIYLPEAGESDFLREIEVEIKRNERFL